MTEQEQVVQILRDARSYVERGWCQGAWARNAVGEEDWLHSQSARAWCVAGAIIRATRGLDFPLERENDSSRVFAAATQSEEIDKWNDAEGRTNKEVLDAFDRAIALAEQGVQP